MARSTEPRWYVVRDRYGVVLESELLPPGADLWAVLHEVLETRAQRGWLIEEEQEPKYGVFFCRLGDARLQISIQPTDPALPVPSMYGPSASKPE